MAKAATQTLSSSENAGNTLVRWNERARPRWAMRLAGVPVISLPSKMILPEVGGKVPVSRLKSVVLPAPFGPMIECRLPASMARLTSFTATRAPKDLLRLFCFEDRHAKNRFQTSTTPPLKKSTTITNATPSSSGQRAHTTLIDSDSQMKTNEPMIGP